MDTSSNRVLVIIRLSVATCVIYDHATTLDEEVELIWKRPKWTAVQFFFFLNRYVGDALQIYAAVMWEKHVSAGVRRPFGAIVYSQLTPLFLGSMQAIMVYRVCSMHNNDRKIKALLFTALILECVGVFVVQSMALFIKRKVAPHESTGIFRCSAYGFPPWMFTIGIPIVCFEALVLGFSLSLALKYYQSTRALRRESPYYQSPPWHNKNSLAYILLRDSITFPFISMVVCTINLFSFLNLSPLAVQISLITASFTPCITGPRLILNLRETYYQPFVRECGGFPSSDEGRRINVRSTHDVDLIDLPT
ncbi:hypothetical protein GALMADRAFT_1241518 [Galerina marginata CBS 339.88]|uniref:DUF6533 domain-containing protein n=1 Tax=Galerina marginata (strain CBS 339.88) TaxID=685588 RepID=A0A067TKK5_GALM3|nr:hypothetical protein GALMADRAFT_1241518 [Galerina marginata CBS 339.88]